MTPAQPKSQFQSIVQFALIFLVVYLASQIILQRFFPQTPSSEQPQVEVQMVDDSFSQGHHPEFTIKNNTSEAIVLLKACPEPPVSIEIQQGGDWKSVMQAEEPICDTVRNPGLVEPGKTVTISLAAWKYAYFNQLGTYQLTFEEENIEPQVMQFRISEPNMIVSLFRTIVTQPLLNALVFVASIVPGHNLGWSIVILTILIKLILYIPTHSALKSQRKMQVLQPKIDELRKKHKNDPQALNKATLDLWKREKVNPFQSCLPLLIQFPVLLGLFFVIRDGGVLEASRHLLYDNFSTIDWSFSTNFLGLDLLVPNVVFLPLLLVVLQFAQLKLSFAKIASTKPKVVDVTPKAEKKKKDEPLPPDMQAMQQKFMLYGLPLMIGFFAIQFPAAVSLYWAVSTLFAIIQQLFVNKAK